MKKQLLILFALLIIAAINANSQTISGIVVDENQKPMEAVSVVLHTADSVMIEGTATDKTGKFILQKNSRDTIKRLTFSYTGYQTKTINVVAGNIGEIMLLPAAQLINEVVVIGSNTVFKDGKRIVTPTAEQLSRSVTGFVLLDNLTLPRLDVDIVNKTVSVFGGGRAVLLINGRETDIAEIMALDPKSIINVEYSDMPTARFSGAAITVNFIVKQIEKGGNFVGALTNGLTMIYGEDMFSARFYNGASQFSIWYMPQFRDLKSQWRENSETFNFPSGTLKREETGEPARFRYLFNNVKIQYNYYKNGRIFDVLLSDRIESFPDNNFKSKLFTNTSPDTLFMTDNTRTTAQTPKLRLYYQEPLGENQMLYVSVTGEYNRRTYKRDYREFFDDNSLESYFYSDVREKQQVYNASVSYENMIDLGKSDWKMDIDGSLKHRYAQNQNTYNNDNHTIISKMYVNNSELSGKVRFLKNNNYIVLAATLYRNNHKINNVSLTKYNPSIALGGRYKFNKKNAARLDFMIAANGYPDMSYLDNTDQFIDSLQIRRGNPYLIAEKFYQSIFEYVFQMPKLTIFTKLIYVYMAEPLMESSFIENNYIIRTVENHKSYHSIRPEVLISTQKLFNFINLSFYCGMERNISYGNTYTHTNTIYFCSGRISMNYKKWQLMYNLSHRNNDSFLGETLEREEGGDRIGIYYSSSKIYVGIGVFNPFIRSSLKNAQINYSAVAPYKRYEYTNDFRRGKGIFVTLTKKFKWGQQKDDNSVDSSDESTGSAILKGKK